MNQFVIEEKLPSLNEYVRACRSGTFAGSSFKKKWDSHIGKYINRALANGSLIKPKPPIVLNITWHERTIKRDADNIASAKKFILDAMVERNVIEDDSRKYVKGFHDTIVDDVEDYVEVEIIEVQDKGLSNKRIKKVNSRSEKVD